MKKFYSKIKEKYHRFDAEVNAKGKSSFRNKVTYAYSKEGKKKLFKFTSKFYNKHFGKTSNRNKYSNDIETSAYEKWRIQHTPNKAGYLRLHETVNHFLYQPKISILLEIENPNIFYLKNSIYSVIGQIYQNWELIICGNPVQEAIELSTEDNRIKLLLNKNLNDAISHSTGEFISILGNEDQLAREALYEVLVCIREEPNVDFIYCDHDKVNIHSELSDPQFKPDFSPDYLLCTNYIKQLFALRKTFFVSEIKEIKEKFSSSKIYDILFRITESTDKVHHISKILYHEKIIQKTNSTKAIDSDLRVVTEALKRRNIEGIATLNAELDNICTIRYKLKNTSKISIVIPTKDKTSVLKKCLDSIFKKSSYQNFEVILVDNGSSEPDFFNLIEKYKADEPERFKCLTYDIPFNFSKLVNYGVDNSSGEYSLLLNNDTEIITPDWMEGMLEQAQRKSIGVVGAQLIFPNNTIQHCGIILGMGGVSAHRFISYDREASGYSNLIKSVNNVSALTGACIMTRKDLYQKVGGFDPEFAVEFNDIDFCLKIRELGFNNIYLPHVKLYHYESLSRGNQVSSSRLRKEINLVKQRWGQQIKQDPYYNPNLSLEYTDYRL